MYFSGSCTNIQIIQQCTLVYMTIQTMANRKHTTCIRCTCVYNMYVHYRYNKCTKCRAYMYLCFHLAVISPDPAEIRILSGLS